MKRAISYLDANWLQLLTALVICGMAFLMGTPDPAAAGATLAMAGMGLNTLPADEALKKALSEAGLNIKEHVENVQKKLKEMTDRVLDCEQKLAHRPVSGMGDYGDPVTGMAKTILESEGVKAFASRNSDKGQAIIPAAQFKAAITAAANSTTGTVNPLVPADRRPGIVSGPQRRMTIRDLFTAVPTESGMVEFCKENVFTNNAGPQYDGSSPSSQTEGATKNESGFTFTLSQVTVATIAHWVPASRQVLSDSAMLERYLRDRLLYGLKIEEEDELITGDGTSGTLHGLVNQSTAYTGGATNQTLLDTLATAYVQLLLADYEPTGYILNPAQWLSLMLAKDTQGRYLLGDPANMPQPRIWGLPVVASNSMTAGRFMCLDAPRAGYIADREDAVIRISESHGDFFVRNLVAILCEERLALVIERSGAIVYGDTSHAG